MLTYTHSVSILQMSQEALKKRSVRIISVWLVETSAGSNSVTEELFIDSTRDYPKKSQHIPSIQPIRYYTNDLIIVTVT